MLTVQGYMLKIVMELRIVKSLLWIMSISSIFPHQMVSECVVIIVYTHLIVTMLLRNFLLRDILLVHNLIRTYVGKC